MKPILHKSTIGLIFGTAIVLASSTSLADGNSEYAVSYGVDELATLHGQQSVLRRIEQAAQHYCPTYRQIRSHADVQTCVDDVVNDLVEKIGHEKFSRFVANRQQGLVESVLLADE